MIQFSIDSELALLQQTFPVSDSDVKLGIIPDGDDLIVTLADEDLFAWRRIKNLQYNNFITQPVLFDNFPCAKFKYLNGCTIRFASGTGSFLMENETFQLPLSVDSPRIPHLSRVHMVDLPELKHFKVLNTRVDLIVANAKGCFSSAGKGIAALGYTTNCNPHEINDRDNCFVPHDIFYRGVRFVQPSLFSVHTAGLALIGEEWMIMCRRSQQDTAYDPVTLLDATKENSFEILIEPMFDPKDIAIESIPEDTNAYVIGSHVVSIKARLPAQDFVVQFRILNKNEVKHFSFKIPLRRFMEALMEFNRCAIYPPRDLFSPVGIQKENAWLWIMPAI